MTLRGVIAEVDSLKPNQYTGAQKVRWLSECDSMIYHTIIATHKRPESDAGRFVGYDPDTDMDTELLVKAPYDTIYRYYLEMQIELNNKELNSYNNTSRVYNTALLEFQAAYNRDNMPIGRATHFKL